MELKKIDALSLAKIAAFLGVIYGLVSAIIVVIALRVAPETAVAQMGSIASLGYYNLLLLPIMNGIIYAIIGLVGASLYNLASKWFGGVKLELK